MHDGRDYCIPLALCQAAVGEMVLNYIEKIDSAVIEKAMEGRAIGPTRNALR